MPNLAQSDLSGVRTEFRAALDAIGIPQRRAAELFGVGVRSIRRWRDGERRVPSGVSLVVRLLVAQMVTVDQIEQVARAVPARTNGGAEPEPPAPLPAAPAPEQSAAALTEAAALAGPDLTTAEAIAALAPSDCRWPLGDPGCAGFRFCGNPATRQPYCEHHRALAYYAAPRTGGGQGGLVSRGRRSPATERLSTGASSTSCAATAAVVAPTLRIPHRQTATRLREHGF